MILVFDVVVVFVMVIVRCGDQCSVVVFFSKEGIFLQGVGLGEMDFLLDVFEKFVVISLGKVDCLCFLKEVMEVKNGGSSVLFEILFDVFIVYIGFKIDFFKDVVDLLYEYDKSLCFVLCSLSNSLF